MPIFKFVVDKFDAIPRWVRVTTYLVLLAVSVYLYLAPRFVSGQMVARTASGGLVPYRGTEIQTRVAGHTLKFRTNEDGNWTIPIVDRKPGPIKLQVFHQDDHSWFPVEIGAADMWTKDFRIVISADDPFVTVETAANEGTAPAPESRLAAEPGLFVGAARAGALEIRPQGPPPVAALDGDAGPPSGGPPTTLMDEVRQVVADVTGKALVEVGPEFQLTADNGAGYVQRIQIVEELERTHEIKIPDEHWRSLNSVQELADYLAGRQELAAQSTLPEELSRSGDWAKIQQSFAPAARPKFK